MYKVTSPSLKSPVTIVLLGACPAIPVVAGHLWYDPAQDHPHIIDAAFNEITSGDYIGKEESRAIFAGNTPLTITRI